MTEKKGAPKVGDVLHLDGRDYTLTAVGPQAVAEGYPNAKGRPMRIEFDGRALQAVSGDVAAVVDAEAATEAEKFVNRANAADMAKRAKASGAKAAKHLTKHKARVFYLPGRLIVPAHSITGEG